MLGTLEGNRGGRRKLRIKATSPQKIGVVTEPCPPRRCTPPPHRGSVAREDAGEGRRRAATGLPVGQGTQGTGVRPQTRDRENRQIAVSAELERSFREPKKVPNLRQNRSISALGLPRRDL